MSQREEEFEGCNSEQSLYVGVVTGCFIMIGIAIIFGEVCKHVIR